MPGTGGKVQIKERKWKFRFGDLIFLHSLRLPVLDSEETIEIIKEYLEITNFSTFEVKYLKTAKKINKYHGLSFSNGTALPAVSGLALSLTAAPDSAGPTGG